MYIGFNTDKYNTHVTRIIHKHDTQLNAIHKHNTLINYKTLTPTRYTIHEQIQKLNPSHIMQKA